jgi:uncharacterized membrane protein YdbT with pleckstrin-like domain
MYGMVAEVISHLLTLPLPIFVFWFLYTHSKSPLWEIIIAALIVYAIMAIPGKLSAFLARKVKSYRLKDNEK